VRDLSHLAANSMTVTSQEGGNLVHDNSPAMTAPGSAPVTPMPDEKQMPDPVLDVGPPRAVGAPAHGHGQPGKGYSPAATTWKAAGNG
jgi:hypothetical protein